MAHRDPLGDPPRSRLPGTALVVVCGGSIFKVPTAEYILGGLKFYHAFNKGDFQEKFLLCPKSDSIREKIIQLLTQMGQYQHLEAQGEALDGLGEAQVRRYPMLAELLDFYDTAKECTLDAAVDCLTKYETVFGCLSNQGRTTGMDLPDGTNLKPSTHGVKGFLLADHCAGHRQQDENLAIITARFHTYGYCVRTSVSEDMKRTHFGMLLEGYLTQAFLRCMGTKPFEAFQAKLVKLWDDGAGWDGDDPATKGGPGKHPLVMTGDLKSYLGPFVERVVDPNLIFNLPRTDILVTDDHRGERFKEWFHSNYDDPFGISELPDDYEPNPDQVKLFENHESDGYLVEKLVWWCEVNNIEPENVVKAYEDYLTAE